MKLNRLLLTILFTLVYHNVVNAEFVKIEEHLYCILAVPMEHLATGKLIGVEEMYAICKVISTDQASIPENEPLSLFVDCTESIGWLVKHNKNYLLPLRYWTRYGRDTCHEQKPIY